MQNPEKISWRPQKLFQRSGSFSGGNQGQQRGARFANFGAKEGENQVRVSDKFKLINILP